MSETGFRLEVREGRLELVETGSKKSSGICVDFTTGPMKQLIKSAGRGQPLAKALSIKRGDRVVDATAGLGKDTIFLAALGCEVTAVEKNSSIFALLEDGVRRGQEDKQIQEILKRVHLVHADAQEYLESLRDYERPDSIYIDPMFPEGKKTALPKKEMQIFRAFLGADTGSKKLLEVALKTANSRVVVKRPSWAEPLIEPVQHRFDGKLVSFDSYLSSPR